MTINMIYTPDIPPFYVPSKRHYKIKKSDLPDFVRPKHPIDFKSNKIMVKAWKQFQKTGKY